MTKDEKTKEKDNHYSRYAKDCERTQLKKDIKILRDELNNPETSVRRKAILARDIAALGFKLACLKKELSDLRSVSNNLGKNKKRIKYSRRYAIEL